MKLTATRYQRAGSVAWTLRLDSGIPIGSVWEADYNSRIGPFAYGWRTLGQEKCNFVPTRDEACAALIAACGIDSTPPEVWP